MPVNLLSFPLSHLSKYIQFFVMFNTVLVTYGLPYIYVLLMLLSVVMYFFSGMDRDKLNGYWGHIGYIFLLFVITASNMIFISQDATALVTLGLYTLPIICWILFYSIYSPEDFKEIFLSIFYLSVLVSFLGILQYYYSPSLWGTIPIESKSIAWAMEKKRVEYSVFFRATSTLGSPQVFGLFCALTIIIAHRFKEYLPKKQFALCAGVLFLGGTLSGNKSFFLIVFLYVFAIYLLKYIKQFKYLIFMVFSLFIFILSIPTLESNIPMLSRIFTFNQVLDQEGSDSRLSRYSYIFQNTNALSGNGMGKNIVEKHKEGLKATESYILKIYFECGLFAAITLCALMAMTALNAWRRSAQDCVIVLLIFFSMVIVHAFQSPVFYVFWGYLLSFFVKEKPIECPRIIE